MTAVEARRLTRYFGVQAALRQASFTVDSGNCVALLGRNGAGKSTLLRLLAGLQTPSEGTLTVFGENPLQPATRRRIGFLGHGSGLYDELSAEENLRLAARIAGLAHPKEVAKEWLTRIRLDRVGSQSPYEFSRGMRQRLALARVLLPKPGVLLLDEPLTALDDRATRMVCDLLADVLRDGATILMSTHHLSEGMHLSNRVLLLERGAVAYSGERTAAMLADPASVYSYAGDSA